MIYGQCIRCGKVITYDKVRYCDNCKEYFYHLIRDYLYEHQQEKVTEICKKLHIPKVLNDYYIDNELLIARGDDSFLKKNSVLKTNNNDLQNVLALKKALLEGKKEQSTRDDFSGAKMYFIGSDTNKR